MEWDMDIKEVKSTPVMLKIDEYCPDVCCSICMGEIIGTPEEGCDEEVAYKLPCSHVFGSSCILRWLQISPRQDCPQCRRRMVHSGCGHLLMPSLASTAPPPIREEETPANCVRCRGQDLLAKSIKRQHEKLLKSERALRGARTLLPRFFGGTGAGELYGTGIEERIEDLRKDFAAWHDRAWQEWEESERRQRW